MAKRYPGIAADARALAAYVKLLRAGEGVLRESSLLLALYDLTPGQFGVLESLYQSGPRDSNELEGGILGNGGNLSALVEGLRKRGLVRRSLRSARGARRATLGLTPKGRNLVRSVLPGRGAAIVSVMGRLSAREQETLGRLCQKLGAPPVASFPRAKPASASSRRAHSRRKQKTSRRGIVR